MTLPIHALRVKLTAAAIGALVLTAGHAVAKNHDCPGFTLPATGVGLHDRAPGPSARIPN